ncbi:beta-microseminoprotein-like [Erpetoichthys calabaricus]|uniref:beta-microseminoprotein-like n=1 Tax=Erpetoichthys calabaricus TaxID=27687 RepID=UPI00109F4078|nr:beta-microseminoprotein-like [Erpetoichthys calabaricus]
MAFCRSHISCLTVLGTACLALLLVWMAPGTEAAVYHHAGKCKHKEKLFKPGESFARGCDKCYCHKMGFTCVTPTKPTSWPESCKPVFSRCEYRIVSRDDPHRQCRAYSWIG